MKKIIIGISLILLTGCATGRDSPETITKHKSVCSQYGLQFGTLPFADCMYRLRLETIHPNSRWGI